MHSTIITLLKWEYQHSMPGKTYLKVGHSSLSQQSFHTWSKVLLLWDLQLKFTLIRPQHDLQQVNSPRGCTCRAVLSSLCFFSVQLAALVGFSSEREFLLGVICVKKKVRLKNTHGVERSEVCGAHFFSRDPVLSWLSRKLYLLQGQELDWILVCPF